VTRAVALAAVGLWIVTRAAAQAPADPLAARSRGRADAPVVVYEMADFQCPACRQFALETMPAIEREYVRTGKVRFVFINFPLSVFDSTFHRNAGPAAELAMCAARQGRFWPAHDALFQRQTAWAPMGDPTPYFAALADTIGLDRAALAACLADDGVRSEITADAERAYRSGARSTPTFWIAGGMIDGAIPLAAFRVVLDSIHGARTAPR
jgi:protein-disulfide isomerase